MKKEGWGKEKNNMLILITQIAINNGIDAGYMAKMAYCESEFNPRQQSNFIQPYGREQSYGLFQIHTKVHTNVSVEQAKDPIFNTEWSAKEIKKGKAASHWVKCHKVAQGNQKVLAKLK